jgi:hypothetical protein
MNAYFTTDDGVVTVRMRAESADGVIIGDAMQEIRAGQHFAGVAYADLVARGAGTITLGDNGRGTLRPAASSSRTRPATPPMGGING